MDKALVKQIADRIEQVLTETIGKEFGVTVEIRGGTFDPSGAFSPRLTLKQPDADRAVFAKLAPMFGLKVEDFGREVRLNGRVFTLVALAPGAPTFPAIVRDDAGKEYGYRLEPVKRALGR